MSIRYLETNSTDPCVNLATEQYVLENKREGDWLMLWQNYNTVVVGLNQNTMEEINLPFINEHNISVVRRMTGGGAVYHDLGNLNYSFISDLGDADTLTINRFTQPVCRALARMGIMAETSGRNDIIVDGKKVSGVAQRICSGRILHHGTLLFNTDGEMIAGALNVDPEKFRSKSSKSVRSRVGKLSDYLPEGMELKDFWELLLRELTRDEMERTELAPEELARVQALAESRYRSWDWTYGRSPDYNVKANARYPGGALRVLMNVSGGVISSAAFEGDFMAVSSNAPLCEALAGARFDKESVTEVLRAFELGAMFGAISEEEILATVFD